MNLEGPHQFFIFFFYSFLLVLLGEAFGLFGSSVVSNKALAIDLGPLFLVPMFLFSEYFVSTDNAFVITYPFKYFNPIKYAFTVYVLNEYDDLEFDCEPD